MRVTYPTRANAISGMRFIALAEIATLIGIPFDPGRRVTGNRHAGRGAFSGVDPIGTERTHLFRKPSRVVAARSSLLRKRRRASVPIRNCRETESNGPSPDLLVTTTDVSTCCF